MDFKLSKEQELIQKTAREFAEKRLQPIMYEIDQNDECPTYIYEEMAELGLCGVAHPEEYGGSGSDYISYALTLEQLGRFSTAAAIYITTTNFLVNAIRYTGTEEQKAKWLPDMCSGKTCGTFIFTEPATGSDARALKTTATLKGDEWILNGTKRFATNAHLKGPMGVFAVDDQSGQPTMFIIEKLCPGYELSEPWNKIGWRGSHTCDVTFKNVRIPKENVLGEVGEGFKALQQAVGYAKISILSLAVGRAQQALDESIQYSKDRIQRGKPISKFPTLRARLANMKARVEACRLMLYKLAYDASEAKTSEQRMALAQQAAMCKLFIAETCLDVVRDGVQIHGSYGLMKGYQVELAFRDSLMSETVEGVKDVQLMLLGGSLVR